MLIKHPCSVTYSDIKMENGDTQRVFSLKERKSDYFKEIRMNALKFQASKFFELKR